MQDRLAALFTTGWLLLRVDPAQRLRGGDDRNALIDVEPEQITLA